MENSLRFWLETGWNRKVDSSSLAAKYTEVANENFSVEERDVLNDLSKLVHEFEDIDFFLHHGVRRNPTRTVNLDISGLTTLHCDALEAHLVEIDEKLPSKAKGSEICVARMDLRNMKGKLDYFKARANQTPPALREVSPHEPG